jgi:hypothetical protein
MSLQVKLRHHDDTEGVFLCRIEPQREAIERLVALLELGNGVTNWRNGGSADTPSDWRFVLDETEAYVEIILGEPDDE